MITSSNFFIFKKYKISIIFENKNFIVLNKPSKISSHSGTNNKIGLIDILKIKKKSLQLCHRLDKNTSGCIVLSKNKRFLIKFQFMLRNKKIKKEYHAIVHGNLKENFFIVTNQKILNKYNSKIKDNFNNVITYCEIIKSYINYSLLRIFIYTGKLHQIRIHLAYIGHPIICDNKYGNYFLDKNLLGCRINNIFLHARSLFFKCPLTNETFLIKAEYTPDLKKIIYFFEREYYKMRYLC